MGAGDRHQTGASGSPDSSPDEQRTRLISAMTRTATERGYANTTVDQVAAYAGVTRETFFRHFTGTDQCLVAAYDSFFERLMSHIEAACDSRDPWPIQVRAGVGATLGFFAEVSSTGRVFLIEAMGAGPAAVERHFASIDRLARKLGRGREFNLAAEALPDATERTLVAGIGLVISAHLLAEEGSLLPAKEAELTELVLTPYLGGREAKRIAGS
jgi:AcrR family transcriptional regulator